jgi:hypothetical protein
MRSPSVKVPNTFTCISSPDTLMNRLPRLGLLQTSIEPWMQVIELRQIQLMWPHWFNDVVP